VVRVRWVRRGVQGQAVSHDDPADPTVSAAMHALAQGSRWLTTRITQLEPGTASFVVKSLHELLYPYVKVSIYVDMAEKLRQAQLDDVADVLDAKAHEYLDALLRGKEEP